MTYKIPVTSSGTGITLLVLLLLGAFMSGCNTQTCNANLDQDGPDSEYVEGRCVTFRECPTLYKVLRSPYITAAEVRILQRLTCFRDNENPTVCCETGEIIQNKIDDQETSDRIGINPDSNSSPTPEMVFPSAADPLKPIGSDKDTIPEDTSAEASLRNKLKLLPSLEECGTPPSEIPKSDRIIGGTNASHGSYPWMARIGYKNLQTGEIEFFCGGTLINRNYILTAAHCTKEVDLSEHKPSLIRLGEHNADTEIDCSYHLNCTRALDFDIEKMIPHPGYSVADKSNDIELIRFRGNVPYDLGFVKPICLPFGIVDEKQNSNLMKNVRSAKSGVATGWGRTKWDRVDGSSILQEVILPIVSNDECQANYSTKIHLTKLQMCAGGVRKQDSCGGDSGGPLAVSVPFKAKTPEGVKIPFILEPKFFQLGVVSFGPVHCGVGGLPGIYTRVSAYSQWILESLET